MREWSCVFTGIEEMRFPRRSSSKSAGSLNQPASRYQISLSGSGSQEGDYIQSSELWLALFLGGFPVYQPTINLKLKAKTAIDREEVWRFT